MNFHRLPLTYNILSPNNIDIKSNEPVELILSKTLCFLFKSIKKENRNISYRMG